MTTVDKIHPVALRSAGSKTVTPAAEATMVESALVREEERNMVDEEITSDEENPEEDRLLQAAIAESVAHTRRPVKATRLSDGSPRFVAKKRRRPSESLSTPELAHSNNDEGAVIGNPAEGFIGESIQSDAVKLETLCGDGSVDAPVPAAALSQSAANRSAGNDPGQSSSASTSTTPGVAVSTTTGTDNGGPIRPRQTGTATSAGTPIVTGQPPVRSAQTSLPPSAQQTATVSHTKPPPIPIVPAPSRMPLSTLPPRQQQQQRQDVLPPASTKPAPSVSAPPASDTPRQVQSHSTYVKQEPVGQASNPMHPPPPAPTSTLSVVPRHLLQHDTAAPAVPLKPAFVPAIGSVPNPLSKSLAPTAMLLPAPPRSQPPQMANNSKTVPCPLTNPVPCPLPPSTFETESVRSAQVVPKVEKKVTITLPEAPPASAAQSSPTLASVPESSMSSDGRPRVFSVDIDPSAFDFTSISKSDNLDDLTSSPTPELSLLQRDRGYSFEVFNFAGDELLPSTPTLPLSSTELPEPARLDDTLSVSRPRGDSIIFDPISFQDGGIHEKNALMKPRASALPAVTERSAAEPNFTTANTGISETSLPQPTAAVSSSVRPQQMQVQVHDQLSAQQQPSTISAPHVMSAPYNPVIAPPAPASTPPAQMATLPSALNNNAASGSTPATFQMELLNKDGRIGIYLPEERKARIARFHAKRKMRIWRKRIKYDCRKKLADSRPRVKGRFVKRSEMGDGA